jgi:HSP20 family protein
LPTIGVLRPPHRVVMALSNLIPFLNGGSAMMHLAQRPNRANGTTLDLPRSVDDLFTRFWGGLVRPAVEAWLPPVDIIETPHAYLLRVEIPGIDPKNVDVTLTGDTLTVRGEKPAEENLSDQTWCLIERTNGKFERSFRLPAAASPDEVEAEARLGVLAIRVSKAREAQPRKITIRQN